MGSFVPVLQGKIDVALSNYARMYTNAAFVSDRVFPRVSVTKQSDKFWQFGRKSQEDPGDELRAPQAAAIELRQDLSTSKYFCDDHAASRLIADEERAGFEAGDVEEWATKMVIDRLLLKKEIRLKDIATNAANYVAANKVTLAGATQWTNAASTPVADVLAGRKQVGLVGTPANVMVIGQDSFEALKVHKEIIDRFVNVKAGAITLQDLQAIFELEVVLSAAVERSAGGVQSYVWPDSAWIGHVQAAPNMMDVSFGKTFVWITAPGTAQGFGTEINRVTPASRKSDSLDVHFYYEHQIVAPDAGFLIIDTNL